MSPSSFLTLDGEWYRPTSHARGPWDPNACHGGPPSAAIAREIEALAPEFRLTRLSVDLLRPIPFSGFRIEAELVHDGRTVSSVSAELVSEEGKVCARARGLLIARAETYPYPTVAIEHPAGVFSDAEPGDFFLSRTLHDLPAFNGDGVEVRFPPDETAEPGPTVAWMRTVPLLDSEPTSPFQRICPLADCGNAIGRNAEPWEVSFLNPDLTIALHRNPKGDWLGSRATCHWQPDGTGLSDALLFDIDGLVGRALQTLVLRPTSQPIG